MTNKYEVRKPGLDTVRPLTMEMAITLAKDGQPGARIFRDGVDVTDEFLDIVDSNFGISVTFPDGVTRRYRGNMNMTKEVKQ